MNLIEALQKANNESREFIRKLDECAVLMKGNLADDDPGLALSKTVTLAIIKTAEKAIASGDLIEMLRAAELHGICTNPPEFKE